MTNVPPVSPGGPEDNDSAEGRSGPPLAWAHASYSTHSVKRSDVTAAGVVILPPDTRIGRYRVLNELGRGGMGVTYVAHDEELDRRVAIKLVRSDIVSDKAQQQLQLEARALARLVHPNIVTVHDVGRHGPQTFIAMEFVPGKPLNAWLRDGAKPWREIVDVFRQAAEGLRAAHAAGVVHRDVKPQNLIVGDDGRVRVLDFGLALLGEPAEGLMASSAAPAGRPDERPADGGQAAGTLAYMAPEQLAGGLADARSDQFSLCLSLYIALYGRPPFEGNTPYLRLAAMSQGVPAEAPSGSQVPPRVHAAVVRGLAFDPDVRWPSLDALLAALATSTARPRSRAMMAAGAALALAGGVLGARFAATSGQQAVCTGARSQVDEVWNPTQRSAIERAMLATGVSYAPDTWRHTAALLDRYAEGWAAAHTDACEATNVRREQSQAALDRRMGCLSRHRRSLRVLTAELARVDAASIAGATAAVANLPPIATCSDPEVGGDKLQASAAPGVAPKLEALEADFDRTEWLLELGKYDEGRRAAQTLLQATEGLGSASMVARAEVQLGRLELALGDHDAAETHLKEGHMRARIEGEHEVALQAATQLVHLYGQLVSQPKGAEDWERHVRAELPGVESETRQANSLNTLGALALQRSKYDQAFELCGRALALWQQALGPEHPETAKALNNLGLVHYARGDYERAAQHHGRVLQVREKALGGEHPSVAFALGNLGGDRYRQGRHAEAADHFARALAISERAWGASHPYAADPPLIGLSLSYEAGGRAAEAVPLAERALSILEGQGADPGGLAEARFALARSLASSGRDVPRALTLARQAHEALRATPGALGLVTLGDVEAWLRAHDSGH